VTSSTGGTKGAIVGVFVSPHVVIDGVMTGSGVIDNTYIDKI